MTEQNVAPDVKALVERLEDQAAAYRYADRPLFASWLTEAATALEAQAARAEAAESRAEAMERALTPSEETKAAYIGRFQFSFVVTDQSGEEITFTPNVPWTTIKQIMAAIRARASLSPKKEESMADLDAMLREQFRRRALSPSNNKKDDECRNS